MGGDWDWVHLLVSGDTLLCAGIVSQRGSIVVVLVVLAVVLLAAKWCANDWWHAKISHRCLALKPLHTFGVKGRDPGSFHPGLVWHPVYRGRSNRWWCQR